MDYNKNKFDRLVDMLLDKNNGNIQLRKDAVKELHNKALVQETLDKVSRHERLYGEIPHDMESLVADKKKQRLDDVLEMIMEVESLNISTLDDFCAYLGIPADSSSSEIIDKAHVVVRSGRVKQPRSVTIV